MPGAVRPTLRVSPADPTERLQFAFVPGADVASLGSNMIAMPASLPRLDILQAAGTNVGEAAASPVHVTLPLGTNPSQTIVVQARNFGKVVPIRVVLTPDSGDSIGYDAQIDNSTANPATTTVNVKFPTNLHVEVNAWTR